MYSMKSSIMFALLSLLFAGINDVVYKKYSSKERSRGMYIFGIGIIWTFLQTVAINLQDISFSYDFISIRYGLAAGLLLTVSNILLLESLTNIDVSLGSTIKSTRIPLRYNIVYRRVCLFESASFPYN
jgi:drug/metabolite transporter (DMT)-like permease